MIKSVTAINHLGESLKMVLDRPEETGIIVSQIDGLGPVKANLYLSESAMMDGGTHNGSRLTTRNIVINLDFRLAADAEDLRLETYKYFPEKKEITLEFETTHRHVKAFGWVESNTPDIFQPESSSQISILCGDPFFYKVGQMQATTFSGIVPEFEFIYENNSLTQKLTEFGEIMHKQENVVNYIGDADVGVTITIHATGPARNITIYNARSREVMYIDTDYIQTLTGSPFSSGDDIIIKTSIGKKSVTLLRAGLTYNILNCLRKGSDWFQLTKGGNIFAYDAEEGALELWFKIENETLYTGV